jgi:hypothetical protein
MSNAWVRPAAQAKPKQRRYRRRPAIFDHVQHAMTLAKKCFRTACTPNTFGYLPQVHAS